MSSVYDILDQNTGFKDRPAYVSFHRVAIEDVPASKKAGRYVAKDVDMVHITQPGSKDIFKQKVPQWMESMRTDVMNGRLPKEWEDRYLDAHERWLKGQEIPLQGTPIKGWGILSPAQQETLIQCTVMTVEDLAALNDEGCKRIGMGGGILKEKAAAWLSQMNDKGPLTMEISTLKQENALLQANVETLSRQVQELIMRVNSHESPVNYPVDVQSSMTITAQDILEDEPASHETLVAAYQSKFGKPPHHLMKDTTIAEKLR